MLLRTIVKDIVEQPKPARLSETLLEDYKLAPAPRQMEIYRFLLSTALNDKHPDIVRQNSYNILGLIASITNRQVIIDSANEFMTQIDRRPPRLLEARVAYAAGILPYMKKSILIDFFKAYLEVMSRTGYSFKSHDKLGGLNYCPDELLPNMIEWLILCYIGEESFDHGGNFRRVFLVIQERRWHLKS